MPRRRVFVANRGEIALRVIDACDRLGFEPVIGVSSGDVDSLPARRAAKAVVIGGPRAGDSYLNARAIVHAALATGCSAIHPGYGFLSERPDFARLCADNGLTFIGPRPAQLEALGDKLSARRIAESVGVPVSPGGPTRNVAAALSIAGEVGYPVLVKAAYGGGGRGMKLVHDPRDLAEAWAVASAEAEAAFGDGTVFVERFVEQAKHVEVQVLGDERGNRIHLAERECSLQFRYQKMLEEAPCAALTPESRRMLHDYALRIAGELEYVSLGTVEFLYDVNRGEFSFLEVNPRVQVEHPVTEAVTGVDLVRTQILAALGEPLELRQQDVAVDGHAIEARLTAQDPDHCLRPSPGRVTRWRPAPLGGVRWDTHLYDGYLIPPYYDALMAKIIAHGGDRVSALSRLRSALGATVVEGHPNTLPLLRRLLDAPAMVHNTVTTHWLDDHLASETLQ